MEFDSVSATGMQRSRDSWTAIRCAEYGIVTGTKQEREEEMRALAATELLFSVLSSGRGNRSSSASHIRAMSGGRTGVRVSDTRFCKINEGGRERTRRGNEMSAKTTRRMVSFWD